MVKQNVFTEKDYNLFYQIANLSQKSLLKTLGKFLVKKYGKEKVIIHERYLVAEGATPIALVAHLDTVHSEKPSQIYFDKEKNVMWSPQGLGADDRAGVFAILKIVESGLRPHVIFTTDEEKGGIGAMLLSKMHNPFSDLRYMIELDRRGKEDCVFYECGNREFEKYIEKFGFTSNWGTYSDICELCPEWEVAGVNLSVGYFYEHSFSELLRVDILMNTIEKVKVMLAQSKKDIPKFKYIPLYPLTYGKYGYGYDYAYGYDWTDYPDPHTSAPEGSYQVLCHNCRSVFLSEEAIPAKGKNGLTVFYCPDCCVDHVEWCSYCGEAFEKTEGSEEDTALCPDCQAYLKALVKGVVKE